MKLSFKIFVETYFDSWWLPSVVAFLILAGVMAAAPQNVKSSTILANCLFVSAYLGSLGILAAAVWNFVKKRWGKSIINLLMFPVLVVVAFFSFLILYAMSGPSEDGFGKDIVIPPDMVLEEPRPEREEIDTGTPVDAEGADLVAVFSDKDRRPPKVTVNTDMKVLDEFVGHKKSLLLRHLATSAKWHLTQERGKLYAYRRFVTGNGRWGNSLHGYYTRFQFGMWGEDNFQFRIILGIDGPVMNRPWLKKATVTDTGSGEVPLRIKRSTNSGYDSYLVLRSKGPALEIFEQAETTKRPFTPLALSVVERELAALLVSENAKEQGFDPILIPPDSVRTGPPDIWLVNGMQGGIYLVYACVNPGEQGYVYLKVFEATKNTPLSTHRIPGRSTEYTGWSHDPEEQFFYNTRITVYEGDWGVYYPARFELWFVPESGEPERMLIEKIFKIEGWQR